MEYAKASPRDVLMHITITNRGPESARLHVLPQLWFRNIWSWRPEFNKPSLAFVETGAIAAEHYQLGNYHWYIDGGAEPLCCFVITTRTCADCLDKPMHRDFLKMRSMSI